MTALLRAVFLLWLASLAVFVLPALLPGNPALLALTERNQAATPENVAALKAEWRMEDGLARQYARWVTGLVSGDWGLSLRSGRPVADEIGPRLPWSIAIGGGGILLAALLCLPLGFAAARRPHGIADRLTRLFSIAAQTAPSFLVAILAAWLFSAQWRLLDLHTGGPIQRVALPLLLVGIYSLAPLTRIVRNCFVAAGEQAYLRTALAKGLGPGQALHRHAGRPVMLALLAALTPQMTWIVGGTAVVEVAFAIPGLSQLVIESVATRDYSVLRVYVMGVATLMVVVHSGAELIRSRLDPRPVACAA